MSRLPEGSKIAIRGSQIEAKRLASHFYPWRDRVVNVNHTPSKEWLVGKRVAVLTSDMRITRSMLAYGLSLLDQWELVAVLSPGDLLARSLVDSNTDLAAEIGDARAMVYDTGLLFMRDCTAIRRLLGFWEKECAVTTNERLHFVRALYQAKPLFYALPETWVTPDNNGRIIVRVVKR